MAAGKATLKSLAQAAGVSVGTVQASLYGTGRVGAQTRQRILALAREMDYRPHGLARALRSGRTGLIGLFAWGLGSQLHALQTQILRREARRHGYQLLVVDPPMDAGDDWRFPNWFVDGLFVSNAGAFLDEMLAELDTPVVSLGVLINPRFDHVVVDLYPAARAAMEHLLGSRRRRIVFMTDTGFAGRLLPTTGEARHRAYAESMAAAGLPPQYLCAEQDASAASRVALVEHLRRHDPPDAIFCSNDELALGAYRGLRDLGLRVPEQVALVGCDGLEATQYLDAPLTTIVQPWEEISARGWELMERRWREPEAPVQSARLEAKLVVRASTDPAWQPDLVCSPPEGSEIAVPTISVGG